MGIILKVTPEVLKQMAGDIDTQIDDIKKQFDMIDEEIKRTKAFWEGDACDTHQKQYQSLTDEISESVTRLKANPSNLLKMAGLYTETEETTKAIAMKLPEDVIV